MRLPGIYRLRRAARRLRNQFRPTALILLYHRVTDLPSDPQSLCVTTKHFKDHLEILTKCTHLVSLQHLNQALRNECLGSRSLVITFDDGYADNLYNAKPLLERFNIPATVFVTSGYAGRERELWWDQLDRLLLQPGTLPEAIQLNINRSTYQWQLKEWARYSEEDCQRYHSWDVLEKIDPTLRHSLYRSLSQLLRPLGNEEREKVLEELFRLAGVESLARTTHRALSRDEISELDRGGLIEVGSHTATHSMLSMLPAKEQELEIQESKVDLERIVNHPITSFAYPYGSEADYTTDTVTLVREAGFQCACSNFPDIVCGQTNRFQLPRVLVRDWDGETFQRLVEQWFLG